MTSNVNHLSLFPQPLDPPALRHYCAKSPKSTARTPMHLGHSGRDTARIAHRAFTLIELLVVVAVIAILASLLLPVLARAKASARRIQCTSNLHQMAAALRLYVDDFTHYPAFGSGTFLFGAPTRSNYWDACILPYAAANKGVFLCPGLMVPGYQTTASNNWNGSLIGSIGPPRLHFPHPNESYGYNTYGVGFAQDGSRLVSLGLNVSPSGLIVTSSSMMQGAPESAILSPGEMIAIADYDPSIDNDGDDDHPDCLYSYTLTGKHHAGRALVAFCDAHVEYAKTDSWAAPANLFPPISITAVRARWNNAHQIHEGVFYFP